MAKMVFFFLLFSPKRVCVIMYSENYVFLPLPGRITAEELSSNLHFDTRKKSKIAHPPREGLSEPSFSTTHVYMYILRKLCFFFQVLSAYLYS